MTLSKSQYIRALQCEKAIWLHKNRPELKGAREEAEPLFEIGYSVGECAKNLFAGGVEVLFDGGDFDSMVMQTKALLADKTPIIYEGAFKEKNIFAMADILVRKQNGLYDMYEVKASTSVKDYHVKDAAVQYYAASNVIGIDRVFIVHINSKYEKNGELDLAALFEIEEITDEVLKGQGGIAENIRRIEGVLSAKEPDIGIGGHCYSPYECDFAGYCWADIPKFSVFDLYRMSGEKKFELYNAGIVSFDDIPSDFLLTPIQRLQVESLKKNEIFVDKGIIKSFIDKVEYPINYFDFETFQNPIPRFDGQRPYMQIPFQYSLHIKHADGRLEHKEFLGDENKDPRRGIAAKMLSDITEGGSIVAFNKSFEMARIRELAGACPEYRDELLALLPRFVDLIVPFRSLGYYHPDFNGSFSIKSVLPAMFPDEPELSYKALNIQNGGDASYIFSNLHLLQDKTKRDEIRADLLVYCRLDTLAMVKIFDKLSGVCVDF